MRLAVLGHPVSHSRSPAMHNAALAHCEIEGRYRAVDVPHRASLAGIGSAVRQGRLTGANITMPHKTAAFDLSDEVAENGRRAGAVNTWVSRDGVLWGTNTDVTGIRAILSRMELPTSAEFVVLGAGGAARGVIAALEGRPLRVMARDSEAAGAVLRACDVPGDALAWGVPPTGSVVVNCTPLGMRGETLPGIETAAALIDLAYTRGSTPAVQNASERMIPVADGIDVLVAQAAEAFTLWTGMEAPIGVMDRAARNASSG